jgi:nucleoside-diphosphate-sugar epimerase
MTSNTILICGGAGYIGSALTSRILRETNFKVRVFDQLLYGGDSLYPFFNYLDRFKFIQGDLRTFDLDELLNNVDYVVNLAALVGEPICKKFPKEAQEINFDANIKLAKKSEEKDVHRYIFTSTCSNYGLSAGDEMLDENAKLEPVSLYAETKVNSEKILLEQLPKLQTTALRCATAYGLASRVRFDLLLHEFIRDAWTKSKIYVYGAQSWRPIVHVDDIARAILLIIKNSDTLNEKNVYNIGSNDQNFQKISLAELVANRLKTNIEITDTKKDPRNYQVLFDKFSKELKFKTQHKPVETIDQIAYALESGLIDDRVLFESVNVR